jgi:hypothetical protein
MIFNMHCRLSSPTNDFSYSSFIFPHSDYTNISKHDICSHHPDQISTLRHRRRLEDPVISYASNYYVTNPRQTSHSPLPTSISSKDKNIYCDLFNLLERPPLVQQKNSKSCRSQKSRQQHSGFFRRVVRNYFCMPMTVAN